MSRDSVAVREAFERWLTKRWGFDTDKWSDSGEYRSHLTRNWWECWTEAAEAIERLTREAAPQATLQSQQGATGGAEWQHIANEWADAATNGLQWLRNVRDGVSLPEKGIAEMAENIARIRALAHPQAAGSAPGEAMQDCGCEKNGCWCKPNCRRKRTPAAGAGSAPVGVEVLGALTTINRLNNLGDGIYDVRERVDLSELGEGQSSWDHPDVKAYSDAVAVIDAALSLASTKERAE